MSSEHTIATNCTTTIVHERAIGEERIVVFGFRNETTRVTVFLHG